MREMECVRVAARGKWSVSVRVAVRVCTCMECKLESRCVRVGRESVVNNRYFNHVMGACVYVYTCT